LGVDGSLARAFLGLSLVGLTCRSLQININKGHYVLPRDKNIAVVVIRFIRGHGTFLPSGFDRRGHRGWSDGTFLPSSFDRRGRRGWSDLYTAKGEVRKINRRNQNRDNEHFIILLISLQTIVNFISTEDKIRKLWSLQPKKKVPVIGRNVRGDSLKIFIFRINNIYRTDGLFSRTAP
jgi:hypothetical protein